MEYVLTPENFLRELHDVVMDDGVVEDDAEYEALLFALVNVLATFRDERALKIVRPPDYPEFGVLIQRKKDVQSINIQ
jgi:hypothetical protein